jgi:uncharacterized protein YecT (DUF1311 family)
MLSVVVCRTLIGLALGWSIVGAAIAAEKPTIHIFPETTSPDGKYAVAWNAHEGPNFLVEVAGKQTIALITDAGIYETPEFGQQPKYASLSVGWSENSEAGLAIYSGRWSAPEGVHWIAPKTRQVFEILEPLQNAYRDFLARKGTVIEDKGNVIFGDPVALSDNVLVIAAEAIHTINYRPLEYHRLKIRVKIEGKAAKLTLLGAYEIHNEEEMRPAYREDEDEAEPTRKAHERLLAALDETARPAAETEQAQWLRQREAAKLEGKALDDFNAKREHFLETEASLNEAYRNLHDSLDEAGRIKLQQEQERWLQLRAAKSREISATGIRADEMRDELALNKACQRLNALLDDAGRAKLKQEQERWLKRRAAKEEGIFTEWRAHDLEDEADLVEACQQLRDKLGGKERAALQAKQQAWLKVRASLKDEDDRSTFTFHRTSYLQDRFEDLSGKFLPPPAPKSDTRK